MQQMTDLFESPVMISAAAAARLALQIKAQGRQHSCFTNIMLVGGE
jgi:hypothetical protein